MDSNNVSPLDDVNPFSKVTINEKPEILGIAPDSKSDFSKPIVPPTLRPHQLIPLSNVQAIPANTSHSSLQQSPPLPHLPVTRIHGMDSNSSDNLQSSSAQATTTTMLATSCTTTTSPLPDAHYSFSAVTFQAELFSPLSMESGHHSSNSGQFSGTPLNTPPLIPERQMGDNIYFKRLSDIYYIAVGGRGDSSQNMPWASPSHVAKPRLNALSPTSISSHRLAAKLTLLVVRLMKFMNFVNCDDESIHVLSTMKCLTFLGWKCRHLFLNPPSNAAGALGIRTFVLVTPPQHLVCSCGINDPDDRQFIVDFTFKELFVIARPSMPYERLLNGLRPVYVGTLRSLKHTLHMLCGAMSQSLEAQEISVPPWRRAPFLETCYSKAVYDYKKGEEVLDELPETIATSQKLASRFLAANKTLLSQLEFMVVPPDQISESPLVESPDEIVFEKVQVSPYKDKQQVGGLSALLSMGWGL